MIDKLPDCISTYYAVSNGADDALLDRCFTTGAIVRDEGETHEGIAAIRAWVQAAHIKYEYTVEPVEASLRGENVTVITTVTGNFPGSPVNLEHAFRLADDKIQTLEIR